MSSGMYRRTGCGAPFPSFPSRRDAAATIILPGLRAPAPAGAFAPARRVVVRILCLCALVFGVSGAVAQSAQTVPQFTLGTSAVDSVPQTTVVPVQQPPVQVVEHTTVYEESMRSMTRPERRAYRAKLYAQKIDSLVQSRDYGRGGPHRRRNRPCGHRHSGRTKYRCAPECVSTPPAPHAPRRHKLPERSPCRRAATGS